LAVLYNLQHSLALTKVSSLATKTPDITTIFCNLNVVMRLVERLMEWGDGVGRVLNVGYLNWRDQDLADALGNCPKRRAFNASFLDFIVFKPSFTDVVFFLNTAYR
jgi:hypothetical protein